MANEKRLIDANAVLKKMQNWNTKERLINCVEDAPTVDAEPVVHGRWIRHYDSTPLVDNLCSECRWVRLTRPNALWNSNYCPNCGAKMDGGEET